MDNTTVTTETDFTVLLLQVLEALREVHPDDLPGDLAELAEAFEYSHVSTFAQAGLMTRNEGLVVRLGNGPQFQLTVVSA